MSDLRPGEAHELVTKGYLRAELAELRADFGLTKGDLRCDLLGVRGDLQGLRGDLAKLERRLTVRGLSMIAALAAWIILIELLK